MEEQILRLLQRRDYQPSNVPGLLERLRLPRHKQQELQRGLLGLVQKGEIVRLQGNRYARRSSRIAPEPPPAGELIPGRIRMNRQGKGFVDPDDPKLGTIVVNQNATATAMHDDRVLVRRQSAPNRSGRGGRARAGGEVVKVTEKSRTRLVGTFQRSGARTSVIPDDPRLPSEISVPAPRDVGRTAHPGDKVVVELGHWDVNDQMPRGQIIEVLGPADEEGVDMLSVLRQYDLPLHFPKRVLEEAKAAADQPIAEEIAKRLDCRAHQVVTIDPDDAKDFDDAIFLESASGGNLKLWVHIADVSHYVKPGTALDTEARKRGNSTYLVDRVIPMLPEALSNEVCSLKPHVERLTKCVEFLISKQGKVLQAKFHSAIIRSQRRFTYREAFEILKRPPSNPIEEMLHRAHELAQRVRGARFAAGSLNLDFPERKIRLDDHGRILRIEKVENDISHQLIEEFMLLANEAVASFLMREHRPAIYRIHEAPDPERLREYREELAAHQISAGDLTQRKEVQKLLQKLDTLPIGSALKIGFLKSLMRARYAVQPLGHYGLAKAEYTHFTSPIRRYADLVVHRAVFQLSRGELAKGALADVAEHISRTERNSDDAERDSNDVKLFAFLRAQIESGNPILYAALVTETRSSGFFVDVPDLAMSGFVPLARATDDYYIWQEHKRQLIGRRTNKLIRVGDRLQVQVDRVDTLKKQVDFKVATSAPKKIGQPRPSKKRSSPVT